MQSASGKNISDQFGATPGRIVISRPPIEAPTSPRTRLGNYSLLLRPLTIQCIRAINTLRSDDRMAVREESAKAFAELGVDRLTPMVDTMSDYSARLDYLRELKEMFG